MGYKATSFADTTLASNITATSTTLELATGKGDDFPTLTSADWTLVVLTDKNGNREVIRIVARSGDNLTVGTTVGAGANVSGRGYESTMARAITYTDDHSVRCAPTGALIQAMADYSDQGDLTSTTAEISTLHSSGITNADLVKVHAITATKDELNILDGITSTTAELNILDGVTATTDELNTLDGVTVSTANINTAGALCKDIDATAIEIDTVCDGPTARNNHLHSNIGVTGGTGITTSRANLAAALTISVTAASISQSLLKTSTHEQATATIGAWAEKILTYSDYGFNCRVKYVGANFGIFRRPEEIVVTSATYVGESIELYALTSGTMYAIYRYVASSGEVFWVWLLRNKETGKITDADCCSDHCGWGMEDPNDRPQPFKNYDPEVNEVLLFNPTPTELTEILAKKTKKRSVLQIILEDYDIEETTKRVWPKIPVTFDIEDDNWEEKWLTQKEVSVKKAVITEVPYVKMVGMKVKVAVKK